nr:MAG: RNA-dependent RNA polymerase [Sanya mito-like virus 2]
MEKLIVKWIQHSGGEWTISRLKKMRNLVTRYICGIPFMVNSDMIAVDRSGFPKSLSFLKDFVDSGDINKLRFVMTLLQYSRTMEGHGKVDLSSITNPFKGKIKTIDPIFIRNFVKDFDLEICTEPFSWRSIFFTFKGGVYGKQLWTAIESLKDWTGPMFSAARLLGSTSVDIIFQLRLILSPFLVNRKLSSVKTKEWLSNLDFNRGQPSIIDLVETDRPTINGLRPLRKLCIVSDPELKERVICIFDYFSQAILESLSKELFRLLRTKLKQDRTFTQDPIIKNKKDPESKYYSFDLSSATDRFPVEIQRDLLCELQLGNRPYADAWVTFMTKQLTVDHNGKPITYSVGQPMGARSSWSMFT